MSVAAYLRQPSATEALGDTKLTFNAGKGIKEPSLGQELSSLFALVPPATAAALWASSRSARNEAAASTSASSRGWPADADGVRVTYFNNEFLDLIEFVSQRRAAAARRAGRGGGRSRASAPT